MIVFKFSLLRLLRLSRLVRYVGQWEEVMVRKHYFFLPFRCIIKTYKKYLVEYNFHLPNQVLRNYSYYVVKYKF